MRVLMVSWRGPDHPNAGGAELYTLRVLAGLARRGHGVTWLCEHHGQGPQDLRDGVRLLSAGSWSGVALAAWRLLRQRPHPFDVVVDQINVAGFLTPLHSPVPIVALAHQTATGIWPYDGPWWLRRLGPEVERWGLRVYRDVPLVTVSRTTLAELRAHGLRGWADIAYNGLDAPVAGAPSWPKEPVPTLVFLARLGAAAKRLDHALAVHALLRRELPAARLWVVGRGRPVLPVPAGVTYFPNVSDGRRDELLGRAWLLVATSVREGWGRMVLEAAAAATPSAVYATPGLAEAAAAVEGLTAAESPPALAELALGLLRDPESLHSRGRRARDLARRFSWERAVDVWEAALERASRSRDRQA